MQSGKTNFAQHPITDVLRGVSEDDIEPQVIVIVI